MKTIVPLWVAMGLAFLAVPSCKSNKDVQAPQAAGGTEQTWPAVANGGNIFATELYAKLAGQGKGNLFFSPCSIHAALAMTYGGAAGTTAGQMAQTLHYPLPPDKLAHSYGQLLSRLNSQPGNGDQKGCELVVANALWGQAGYAFKQSFVEALGQSYGAGLNQVDFGNPDAASATINEWVGKHTNNKIPQIVSSDGLDSQTRLLLTNAIYFKGTWRTKFAPKETREGPFQIAEDSWITVPMMHDERHLGYLDRAEFQMVELPYVNDELSMFVILPWKAENLARVEKSLTAADLDQCFKDAKPTLVDVTLPKFTFCSEFKLTDTLRGMGMADAFGGGADFSGMSEKEKLFISAVIHKTFVAVDEEGTEAAAATGVGMTLGLPEYQRFKADHPFIFVIRHNATGAILFMGRVANPGGPDAAAASRPATTGPLLGHDRSGRNIVYMIDRSGSMIDSFDFLKNTLVDSISGLGSSQNFHIVAFSDGAPIELGDKKLVPATVANKMAAGRFLEGLNAQGTTEPKSAIRRAFEVLAGANNQYLKLIYFVTDGDFSGDNENVLALIKKLDPKKEVQINTYLYNVREDKAGKEVLEKIARDSGGTYKFFCTKDAE